MTGPQSIIVTWEPERGPPRRVRFDPLSDGSYERHTEVWTVRGWRLTGVERVESVVVESPD